MTIRPRTLSAIVITLNEERNIGPCLDSLGWADEVIVVDSGSADRTAAIARERGAEVVVEPWKGYGHGRNAALERATGEWVLVVDADERVTPGLAAEICRIVSGAVRPAAGVYEVPRRAYFLGRWIRRCGWYPGFVPRLFRNGEARYDAARVHERLLFHGSPGRLRNDLEHYTDDNLFHYLSKFDRYTTLGAEDLLERGRRFSISDLVLRPPFQFLKMYLFRLGFLDGVHGLTLCLLSASYVFVKYAKLAERSMAPPR